MTRRVWLFLVAGLAVSNRLANAGVIAAPLELNPGDHFRLVFVTSTSFKVQSSDITVYDNFVSGVAATAGLNSYNGSPVTWQVLGSTQTVDAISRVPNSSAPIYLLNGTKVASSGSDLWDGTLSAPIIIN